MRFKNNGLIRRTVSREELSDGDLIRILKNNKEGSVLL